VNHAGRNRHPFSPYHRRPQPDEYAPYYDRYIHWLLATTSLPLWMSNAGRLCSSIGRSEADGDFHYAPGKWSAKEVLGHMCDTERVFAYRALRIARADKTPMEGSSRMTMSATALRLSPARRPD